MYIKTKDGREHDREYNSFWGEESTWRVHFRCKICPDAIGESADIAALDTWRADLYLMQQLQELKKELIFLKMQSKRLFRKRNENIDDINDFQPHQVNKKKAVYARHLGMKKGGLPTLQTDGLRIKELYDKTRCLTR